jgi:hypothetical protein
MAKSDALLALVEFVLGIQEDLPDEDDRATLGKAAHYLREYADLLIQQSGKT